MHILQTLICKLYLFKAEGSLEVAGLCHKYLSITDDTWVIFKEIDLRLSAKQLSPHIP